MSMTECGIVLIGPPTQVRCETHGITFELEDSRPPEVCEVGKLAREVDDARESLALAIESLKAVQAELYRARGGV